MVPSLEIPLLEVPVLDMVIVPELVIVPVLMIPLLELPELDMVMVPLLVIVPLPLLVTSLVIVRFIPAGIILLSEALGTLPPHVVELFQLPLLTAVTVTSGPNAVCGDD
jgi:hypothetical protein